MKTFGIIILSIMTGGIYGIVYAITRKHRQNKMNQLERATITYAYAYDEFDKNLSEEDKKIVTNMNVAANELRKAEGNFMD